MSLELTTVLLCDHAQVREGLLFVHSGGVSRVIPATYPASIRVHLALVVHVPAAEIEGDHKIDVRFKYPDTAELIATAEVAMHLSNVAGTYPGEGVNVPQVIDLSVIPFPRPGQVDVQISIVSPVPDPDAQVADLSFWLLPPPAST